MSKINESELIAKITAEVMAALNAGRKVDDHVPVGISVRHVHIKPDDLAVIYGTGAQLTKMRDLRQPGEFAANETVTLIGPRMRSIENVRILGPVRSQTQVEISRTDAILLGLNPPVRRSGDIAGTPGIALAGPKGIITLKEGVILANRHIHLNEADAVRLGVKGDEEVDVEISGDKSLILRKVQVRVGPKFILEMHLDTDDANAAGINCGAKAYIRRR